MSKKTFDLVCRILLLVYLAAVAYLCFAKPDDLPKVHKWIIPIDPDKCVHFCMFFPFPILAYLSTGVRTDKYWKAFVLVLGMFIIGLGLAWGTELIQGATTYRSKDTLDFIADSLGLALSSVLFLVFRLFYGRRQTR